MATSESFRCPALEDSATCPVCRATVAGTVQIYDRYYLLKCGCGSIFMWPRKRPRPRLQPS